MDNLITDPTQDTIGPIPYYPGLRKLVPNALCAILVTYLEMRFPAPQDDPKRLSSLPVTVSVDVTMSELAVNRRTLALSLYALSRVFLSEAKRWSAQRSSREFLAPHHRKTGTRKLYSVVSARPHLAFCSTFVLRRNLPLLRQTFESLGITHLSPTFTPTRVPPHPSAHANPLIPHGISIAGAPTWFSTPSTMADLLLEASQLSGDRRRVRYPRLRKAVSEGLADASVLSAKRKINLQTKNYGVEPELPEEVVERINTLTEDGS